MPAQRKVDYIAAELLAGIIDGTYARALPREQDIAGEYSVSRGTVRSAIGPLAAQGIVTVTHGRAGATVRPLAEWSLFDPPLLRAVLEGPRRRELLAEALECRLAIEPEAAALAAHRATDDDLAALRTRLQDVRGKPSRSDRRPAPEHELHRAVLAAAHNRFLARAAAPLDAVLAEWTTGDSVAHHERICAAIEARDPAAARAAMRERLEALVPTRRRRAR